MAARLVLRKVKFDPILTDIRDRLHCLPIRSRIYFKLHGSSRLLSVSIMASLQYYTSRRCFKNSRNQLFQPSPFYARRLEVIFLCREQKRKQMGLEASPLTGPALCNNLNLPDDLRDPPLRLTVFKQRLKSYLFKQCWCVIQPKLTFAATFQLMHLHSSVRSIDSKKKVTFTLH